MGNCSRAILCLNPCHIGNEFNSFDLKDDILMTVFQEQRNNLIKLEKLRSTCLIQAHESKHLEGKIKTNAIVLDTGVPRRDKNVDSNELSLSSKNLYRVLHYNETTARVANLITDSVHTLPLNNLKPLSIKHLSDIKMSLQSAHLVLNKIPSL